MKTYVKVILVIAVIGLMVTLNQISNKNMPVSSGGCGCSSCSGTDPAASHTASDGCCDEGCNHENHKHSK